MSRPAARLMAACLIGGCLSACATLPPFQRSNLAPRQLQARDGVPTVSDVVTHVQCELLALVKSRDDAFARLKSETYVVYVSLTLDVVETGGLSPSLSFIEPLASGERSLGVSGQYSREAHRIITQTFLLDLDPAAANSAQAEAACAAVKLRAGIGGRLGIDQVVAEGLRHAAKQDFIFPLVEETDDPGALGYSVLPPTFGSTIEFTLVKGLGAGPNWTLTHFTGPGESLLNLNRTTKDTLVLSFASAKARGADFRLLPQAKAAAGRAAQDNATRMILQRLTPGR